MESLSKMLGLNAATRTERLALCGLGDRALERLRALAPGVSRGADAFIDRLYERLRANPDTAALLADDAVVERLRASQRTYLTDLFESRIDERYVERVLAIGVQHHRSKLAPQWYISTYGHFICDHLPLMFERSSPAEAVENVVALCGVVLFDAGIALDAYEMRLAEDARATRWRETATSDEAEAEDPATADPAELRSFARLPSVSDSPDRRRAFIEVDDDVVRRLRGLEPVIVASTPSILADFYEILGTSTLRDLVSPDEVERLEQQVASYWIELARGTFDRPHAASRTRIGVVHERIGLRPAYYLAGLARQMAGILRAMPKDAELQSNVDAFIRGVIFDVTFVIDAYIAARAELLLRTEGYASRLVSGLADGVAIVDAHDRITSTNERFLRVVPISAGILHRMPVESALSLPEIVPMIARARSAAGGRSSTVSRIGQLTYRITAVALDPGPEKISGLVAIVLDDVTEIMRISHSAERAERRLDHVVRVIEAVVWEAESTSLTILAISSPVLELTGLRDVHYLGRPEGLLELVHPDDRERFAAACRGLARSQRMNVTHRLVRANGSIAHIRTTICLSNGIDGEPTLSGISVDVSDLHAADERRAASIGRLAGGIAHELNNALTVIMGNLEVLEADREVVAQMREATERAASVTESIRAFAGRQFLRPRRVKITSFARNLVPEIRALTNPANVELEVSIEDAPEVSFVDPDALGVAILELVRNALESIEKGGRITLRSRSESPGRREVEISIEDNGRGMPEEIRAQAVEPFFTTHEFGANRGLGLSAVYGFTVQSGGRLTIESQPGHGTRVGLWFPVESEAVVENHVAVDSSLPFSVLVVEDDPLVRSVVVRTAKALGYRVLSVDSGEAAVQAVRDQTVEVLFTDVVLGAGIDGVMLASQVHESHPGIAIVIASGYPESQLGMERLQIPHAFLAKPFTRASLDRALSEAAELARAVRERPADPDC